jgi:hypothetical protein
VADILTDFPAIGELVFVTSDALCKGALDQVNLFDRSLVEVVFLQCLETVVCRFNIVK